MTVRRPGRGDRGSALVEFVLVIIVMLVPVTFAAAEVFRAHAASNATRLAAAEAARAFAGADTDAQAGRRARTAAELALGAAGVETRSALVTWRCSQRPCLTPGGRVRVTVAASAPLHRIPVVGIVPVARFSEHHTAVIDSFRAAP